MIVEYDGKIKADGKTPARQPRLPAVPIVALILGLLSLGAPAVSAQPAEHASTPTEPSAAPSDHHHDGTGSLEESNVDYLWRKSDEAFHKGDYERAIGLHRAIVALDPSDIESYSVGAWLLWSLGKGDDALKFIDTGLKANPGDWEMWNTAAQQYDLMKREHEAEAHYQRAVELIPREQDSQLLRRRLAHSAEKAGDLNVSLETWRGLVKDFPNDPVNRNNLARVEKLAASATPTALQKALSTGAVVLALAGLTIVARQPAARRHA